MGFCNSVPDINCAVHLLSGILKRFIAQRVCTVCMWVNYKIVYTVCVWIHYKIVPVTNLNKYVNCGASATE